MSKEQTFPQTTGYISPFGKNSLFNVKPKQDKPKKLVVSYRSTKFDKGSYTITVDIVAESLKSKYINLTVVEKEVFKDENIHSCTIGLKYSNFSYDVVISASQLQSLSKTFLQGDFEIVIKVFGDDLEAQTTEIKLKSKSENSTNPPPEESEIFIPKQIEPDVKTEYDRSGKLISFEVYGQKYDAISIANFHELSLTYQVKYLDGKEIGEPISITLDDKKITKQDLHPEIGSWLATDGKCIYVSSKIPNTVFDLTYCYPELAEGELKPSEKQAGYIHTHPSNKTSKLELEYQMTLGGGTIHGGFPSPDDFVYMRNYINKSRGNQIDVIVDNENILVYNKSFFQVIKKLKK